MLRYMRDPAGHWEDKAWDGCQLPQPPPGCAPDVRKYVSISLFPLTETLPRASKLYRSRTLIEAKAEFGYKEPAGEQVGSRMTVAERGGFPDFGSQEAWHSSEQFVETCALVWEEKDLPPSSHRAEP